MDNWYKKTEKGIFLIIKLTPNASKDEVTGYNDDYIKIRISAPPNENKANKKLIAFLSDFFDVSKSNLEIVSGDKSRLKKVLVYNINEEFLKQKIYVYDKI